MKSLNHVRLQHKNFHFIILKRSIKHFVGDLKQSISVDEKEFHYYGRKAQTPVSLETLLQTGRTRKAHVADFNYLSSKLDNGTVDKVLIQIACFLHHELPVRLAHQVLELNSLDLFRQSPSIQSVCQSYKTSFAQLRHIPIPNDPAKENLFANLIESIYERHSATLITMAKGAHEIRTMLNQDSITFAESAAVQQRLDDFYMSRIGIRMVRNKQTPHYVCIVIFCC